MVKYLKKHLDKISIRNLEINCVVGIYDFEKQKTQELQIDIDLWGHFNESIDKGIAFTADYAKIGAELRFIVEQGQFELLESAAEAMAAYLLFPVQEIGLQRQQIERVRLQIRKPEAVTKALPSLEIDREGEDYYFDIVKDSNVTFSELFSNSDCKLSINHGVSTDFQYNVGNSQGSLLNLGEDMNISEKLLANGEALIAIETLNQPLQLKSELAIWLMLERFEDQQKKSPEKLVLRNFYQEA